MKNNWLDLGMLGASMVAVALSVDLLYWPPPHAGGVFSHLATGALPVLVLTVLLCYMLRREIHVLSRLNRQMDELGKTYGVAAIDSRPAMTLLHFARRFSKFMEHVDSKLRELDQHTLLAEAASRLLVYKHEKAEAVLEAIPDAVLVVDHSCVAAFANSKVEPLLGVRPQDVIGNPPHKWCANKDVLTLLMHFTDATDATVHTGSIEYSPAEHPDRRISVSVYPLSSLRDRATLFGRLVVFRDVSREYVAKQAGAEFVSHVSHELKTPLASLAAHSELLLDFQTLPEAERINAVNVIRDEVERTAALISNLLNISKLETGNLKIERQRVKIHDLLRDSFEKMSRNAAARDVAVELKIPPDLGSARLDKDLFRIAVDNLLSNAIKYSNPGGRVMLRAEYMEDQRIRISVKDQGIGISAEECGKVFEKYYRSGSKEATSRSGHGLGLYVAKQVVELHHGVISLTSTLGKGTTFAIELEAPNARLEEVSQA